MSNWRESWEDDPDAPGLQRATYIRYYAVFTGARRSRYQGTAIAFVWKVGSYWILQVTFPKKHWCSDYLSFNTSVGARRKATTIVKGLR